MSSKLAVVPGPWDDCTSRPRHRQAPKPYDSGLPLARLDALQKGINQAGAARRAAQAAKESSLPRPVLPVFIRSWVWLGWTPATTSIEGPMSAASPPHLSQLTRPLLSPNVYFAL